MADKLREHERKGKILIKSMGFEKYIEELKKTVVFFNKLVKESKKTKDTNEWVD